MTTTELGKLAAESFVKHAGARALRLAKLLNVSANSRNGLLNTLADSPTNVLGSLNLPTKNLPTFKGDIATRPAWFAAQNAANAKPQKMLAKQLASRMAEIMPATKSLATWNKPLRSVLTPDMTIAPHNLDFINKHKALKYFPKRSGVIPTRELPSILGNKMFPEERAIRERLMAKATGMPPVDMDRTAMSGLHAGQPLLDRKAMLEQLSQTGKKIPWDKQVVYRGYGDTPKNFFPANKRDLVTDGEGRVTYGAPQVSPMWTSHYPEVGAGYPTESAHATERYLARSTVPALQQLGPVGPPTKHIAQDTRQLSPFTSFIQGLLGKAQAGRNQNYADMPAYERVATVPAQHPDWRASTTNVYKATPSGNFFRPVHGTTPPADLVKRKFVVPNPYRGGQDATHGS